MDNTTEIGAVNDFYGFTLRVHRDDGSGLAAVILETGAAEYVFTRQQWAQVAAYADQALSTCADDPWMPGDTCPECWHVLRLHESKVCHGRVYLAHSLDGEPCPCSVPRLAGRP